MAFFTYHGFGADNLGILDAKMTESVEKMAFVI